MGFVGRDEILRAAWQAAPERVSNPLQVYNLPHKSKLSHYRER